MFRPSAGETLRAWLLSALVVHGAVAGNPDAKRLYDDLLSNYNKLVRPVVNTSDVLRVCIKLKLSQLIDVADEGWRLLKSGSVKKKQKKWKLLDYPKEKHRVSLKGFEKFLDLSRDPKLESQSYHSGDYPRFVTMSQWAAVPQTLGKSSSHSYEFDINSQKILKREWNILPDWSSDQISRRPDKEDLEGGRSLHYAPYEGTYKDVTCLAKGFLSKNLEKKLNRISVFEKGTRKSNLISNSPEVESTRRKNSRSPRTLKSKGKSHKVNRSEGFPKKFRHVDSKKEFKKILENFRIISEEELWENGGECKDSTNIVPAYFVLKLAEKNKNKPIKTRSGLTTTRSFKLVFANDDEENCSGEKMENSLSSPAIKIENKLKRTKDTCEKASQGENTEIVKTRDQETCTEQSICTSCQKMEQEFRFQREFNAGLLEQLRNIIVELGTTTGLLTDILKKKNENNILVEWFLRELTKTKKSGSDIFELSLGVTESTCSRRMQKNLEPVCSEGGAKESCESMKIFRNDFKSFNNDVSGEFSSRKYNDFFYPAHSDGMWKNQQRKKIKSSVLESKSACPCHVKNVQHNRKGKNLNRVKVNKSSLSKKPALKQNENVTEQQGAEDEGEKMKDLNAEVEEDDDYEGSADEMENDDDKGTEGNVEKLTKNSRGFSKSSCEDQIRLTSEAEFESNGSEAVFYSNEDTAIKLSSRASSRKNLKNQIMTTNLWVEQSWYDYKLRWDPKEYGGVHMLHVPSDHIWRPDIVLYNNADGNYEVTLMTKARVSHTGLVEWQPPAVYKSSCAIDVEFFPYDIQTCVLKLGSWTYDGFKVDLRHMDEKAGSNVVEVGVDLSEFYMSVEWDILEVPAVRNEKFYTCCDEPYLDITFNITMRRKTLFYTVNIIIPCMGISFLTVLTFYLPSDSGEKVTLSISILISLHVFFLLVVEIIPPTSLVVPLLGKYLIFAMILVSISICVTVVVLNVHFRSPQTHRMAPWVKRVFIHILPRLLVMRRPQYHFEPHRFMSRRVIMQTVKGKEIQTSYYPYPYQASAPAENPKIRDIDSIITRQRTLSKEDFSPESLADGEPVFGGSCQIHGPPPQSESEELSLSGVEGGVNGGEDLKSPTIKNPAFSHSMCPPEVHKSCFCVRFIAEHTKMLEDSTKVKEDWKYVAMVLDRLFLWIFTLAVLVGTAGIILQAPTLYDDRIPIDKQFAEIQTSTVIRCPPQ